jgi:peptidyl-prolyl cis-trans isomerase SurA
VVCVAFVLSAQASPEIDNYIAAIVNDSIITFQDVKDASRKSIDVLKQIYMRQPDLLREKGTAVMSDALEALVAKTLIVDEFKNSVGVVPENMLDSQISQQIRKDYVDRQNFRKSLRQDGMSYEKYRKLTHDDMVVHFMLDRNVRSAIIISPQKIESYYTNHLAEYQLGNQV